MDFQKKASDFFVITAIVLVDIMDIVHMRGSYVQ
jgi:hypothetical protein